MLLRLLMLVLCCVKSTNHACSAQISCSNGKALSSIQGSFSVIHRCMYWSTLEARDVLQ